MPPSGAKKPPLPPRNQLYFQIYKALKDSNSASESIFNIDTTHALSYKADDLIFIPTEPKIKPKDLKPFVALRWDPNHTVGYMSVGFVDITNLQKVNGIDLAPQSIHGVHKGLKKQTSTSTNKSAEPSTKSISTKGDPLYIDHFRTILWSLYDKLPDVNVGSKATKKRKYAEMMALQPKNKLPVFNLRKRVIDYVAIDEVTWFPNAIAEEQTTQRSESEYKRETTVLRTPSVQDKLTTAGQYRKGGDIDFVINVTKKEAGWCTKKSFQMMNDNKLKELYSVPDVAPRQPINQLSISKTTFELQQKYHIKERASKPIHDVVVPQPTMEKETNNEEYQFYVETATNRDSSRDEEATVPDDEQYQSHLETTDNPNMADHSTSSIDFCNHQTNYAADPPSFATSFAPGHGMQDSNFDFGISTWPPDFSVNHGQWDLDNIEHFLASTASATNDHASCEHSAIYADLLEFCESTSEA